MAHWIRVASVQDFPAGSAREVVAGDRIVALFHTENGFFALDGLCPHQSGPLGRGQLSGDTVTCPWHGWQFDVATGQHRANPRLQHPRLAVQIDGDDLYVDVSE